MDKHEVARLLEEIGALLELQGENPFKVRAYHNAAREVENLEEDLELVIREKRLKGHPGIGDSIAEKITTYFLTGHLPYYEELKKAIPQGLFELLKIPGLGAKKIQALYKELGIETVEELVNACKAGIIAELKHFGEKTQQNILSNVEKIQQSGRRFLWWEANKIAERILDGLSKLKEVSKAAIAGSLRRKVETIGDIDFLVASSNPIPIMNWFTQQSFVDKILVKGPTKSSIILKQGMQADLRIVPEKQFAFALLYFTGSRDHNIKLRQRANERNLTLNEYGIEPLDPSKPSKLPKFAKKEVTEADIFEILGLSYIAPELREEMGEIEAAQNGHLPHLVEEKDIKGVFHCHTTDSDGHNTLEEMVAAAQNFGWEYFGISDHSKSSYQANGMQADQLLHQVERIRGLNQSGKYAIHVFAGLECDILNNGELDFSNDILKELDYVVISVHRSFNLEEKVMTQRLIKAIENPYATIVGHVTGRLLLRRDPYAVNLPKVIDACIANHTAIELNAYINRLDMDWRFWHKAAEKGLKCCINPDAHRIEELQYFRAGVNIARKGWLEAKDVINTFPLKKMQSYLKKKK